MPCNRTRRRGFMPVVAFYSFLRDKPPAYVGHNPVAASAYSLVFGLYFLAIATGLVMRGASADVGSLHVVVWRLGAAVWRAPDRRAGFTTS